MEDIELQNVSHIEGDIWLVPCVANFPCNYFQPVLQPKFRGLKISGSKGWSKLEDKILRRIVQEEGEQSWKGITAEFNAVIGTGKGRKTRECKERWENHLNSRLKKGHWTAEEDLLILSAQKEKGNKWSSISKLLQGRTQHSVKNRWITLNMKAEKQWPDYSNRIDLLIQEIINNNDKSIP